MKKQIYAFGAGTAEGDGKMKDILGGKGAGLAEMSKAGVPVPPGFTVSTEVCTIYFENKNRVPNEIEKEKLFSQPRAVVQALKFIHENYPSDLSLADIAAAAHLSTYHLTRVFKKSTGVSPHQYLVQVRVNSARSLLTAGAGDRSLAEIAAAVGFADQSHLTRQFRRAFGRTPGRWRSSLIAS